MKWHVTRIWHGRREEYQLIRPSTEDGRFFEWYDHGRTFESRTEAEKLARALNEKEQ